MVGNTGTYLDSPFHRYADGIDLAGLRLEQLAGLPGVKVIARETQRIDASHFSALKDIAGKAILVETGWSRHWKTDEYYERHPFLTDDAAQFVADAGAVLVGIDSLNIDSTQDGQRPVHSLLLRRGILIVEHLTALGRLPAAGFRFSAVPVKVKGFSSFPVRAFAEV